MANAKVLTPEGRFVWLHVFEAKMNYNNTGMEKSLTLLIPKTANLAPIEAVRDKVARDEFGGKIPGPLRRITGGQKPIFKDGDEFYETRDEDKKEMYQCYRGNWVLNITCPESQPLRILGSDGSDIYDPTELYDGCYGQVVLNLSVYQAKPKPGFPGGPMASTTLLGLKKTREGEPLELAGGSVTLTDADVADFFGATPGGSSADDL